MIKEKHLGFELKFYPREGAEYSVPDIYTLFQMLRASYEILDMSIISDGLQICDVTLLCRALPGAEPEFIGCLKPCYPTEKKVALLHRWFTDTVLDEG